MCSQLGKRGNFKRCSGSDPSPAEVWSVIARSRRASRPAPTQPAPARLRLSASHARSPASLKPPRALPRGSCVPILKHYLQRAQLLDAAPQERAQSRRHCGAAPRAWTANSTAQATSESVGPQSARSAWQRIGVALPGERNTCHNAPRSCRANSCGAWAHARHAEPKAEQRPSGASTAP